MNKYSIFPAVIVSAAVIVSGVISISAFLLRKDEPVTSNDVVAIPVFVAPENNILEPQNPIIDNLSVDLDNSVVEQERVENLVVDSSPVNDVLAVVDEPMTNVVVVDEPKPEEYLPVEENVVVGPPAPPTWPVKENDGFGQVVAAPVVATTVQYRTYSTCGPNGQCFTYQVPVTTSNAQSIYRSNTTYYYPNNSNQNYNNSGWRPGSLIRGVFGRR